MASRLGPTIDGLLATRARTHPDRVLLRFASGDLTFATVDAMVDRAASGFAALGVRPGAVVPVMLGNSPEMVVTWLGLCRAGAVACLLNTAFTDAALRRALDVTSSPVVVTSPSHVEALVDAGLPPAVRTAVIVGDGAAGARGPARVAWPDLLGTGRRGAPSSSHGPTEPALVVFTSGTTGVSKGCLLPHRYVVRQAELMAAHLGFRDEDVLYCPFPLFHIDAAVLTVGPALVLGTTAAIGERFSASGFWPEVRRFGATVFDFMGATLTMLHKQPPGADDADNPVRLAWGVPVPDFADEFEARFGLRLVELYGSTDAGVPIYHPVDRLRRAGSCGLPIDAYDVRLVDPEGFEVTDGGTGEIVIRPNEPSIMAAGYLGMPEATVASRRDLWFHTGDLARRDPDGFHYFVGRMTDTIRRRGENVSAFEVEEVVKLHPAVLDAAAFGVPSELTEDDVMVAVVARPGQVVDPADLAAFCAGRLARHMVPRYVDVVADLPRTPTEKVRKEVLRERGVTATTWDGSPLR